MKWRVLVRPRGEADLREIREWYEEQRAGLGAEFLAELTRAMQDLETDPERHAVYYRGFRRLLTRRFPYKVFYRIDGDRVVVFRVLHAHREHTRMLPGK